jgi:ubiquinone/menaquinone biosynthesis C-methylase UbiE
MTETIYDARFNESPAQNYQRYFVPTIGGPVADDLIAAAGLKPGERVLDVACGTGVIARLAAEKVGPDGSVTGLDVNPGMIAVARAATPEGLAIDWHEASAESMPLPDESFDVVFCQMGLQFMSNKLAALSEMRRVLVAGGRALINTPGPKPPLFAVMTEELGRHIGPEPARFGEVVFSLNDPDELQELMRAAGFRDASASARPKRLHLPLPADFLWQYTASTPMADGVAGAGEDACEALERSVVDRWQPFVTDDGMDFEVGMTTATGIR